MIRQIWSSASASLKDGIFVPNGFLPSEIAHSRYASTASGIEKREGGEGTRLWVDDLGGILGLVDRALDHLGRVHALTTPSAR